MNLRDRIEAAIRAWDKYETGRGAAPIIDYDCYPAEREITAATSRIAVLRDLERLGAEANERGMTVLTDRVRADTAYLCTLLGARPEIDEYIFDTQGCHAAGWPAEYVEQVHEHALKSLSALGIDWGEKTRDDLEAFECVLDVADAGDAIRESANHLEHSVREITGAVARFDLTVETTDIDEYWGYWVDGSGKSVRLRLNLRKARFTQVRARQFALHEILGHGLQGANYAERCLNEDVPWVRLLSVHAQHQVLLEGLAQALPLFVTPDDQALMTRVRLDRYLELVRSELHLAINGGATIEECATHAQKRVPFWSDEEIADELTDRGQNGLLRSYLWSYAAGLDWFASLAEAGRATIEEVLRAAYRAPLTPSDLSELWPDGPAIGGPGASVCLRKPALS